MFQPNSVIAGRYQVIRLIGQGGMSNIYLCYDRKYNNAVVVIKEMTASYSDPKEQQMAVELFHREAKLLASLNHRHIPKVYDYFQFAGKYYLSMEFIDGEDLAQRLEAQKGPLPEEQVLEWGEQIATVLFYLHKHEPPIVFRDVKPSNIMLCDQGVKLIDFGIARHFDQSKKGDTMRIGSPGYAPPEQYAAQTDPRSDIYALGVTLHHALTGRDPTATQTPFLVPPARDLNPALRESTAAMLARATQLDPADRYQSMLEMKNDIKAILSRDKQSTRVVGAPPAPPPGPAVAQTPPSAAPSGQTASTPSGGGASGQTPAATPSAAPAATLASAPPATPTAASGPSTGGGQNAPGAQPAAASSPAKKSRLGGWLLVATLLLALGGGLYAVGPSGRNQIIEGLEKLIASLNRGSQESSPEEAIRRLLLSGDPSKLLPLSSQTQLSKLTEDKQQLYRLNLLAAAISKTPTVVHLLYPESLTNGPREAELLRGAGRALSAINGQGGVESNLLVVLPRTYPQDGLPAMLDGLVDPTSSLQQKLIVVKDQAASANLPLKPDVTIPAPPEPGQAWIFSEQPDLVKLFGLNQQESKLWAAALPAPAKSEIVDFDGTAESFDQLMARAESEKMTLVVEADRLPETVSATTGRMLLLAVGTSDLPQLGPKVQAEARVLGSPLRPSQALAITQSLSLSEASIFDAVALTALTPGQSYLGLTLNLNADGKRGPAEVFGYRWSSSAWLPISEESRTP